MAEDAAFAEACGLENRLLELEGASERGQYPFNSGWVRENLQRIESPLLDVLLALGFFVHAVSAGILIMSRSEL
jgi:hypothetical protein